MDTEARSTFGSLYKVACILLFAMGIVTAFPFVVYLVLLGIPTFLFAGQLSLLLSVAVLLLVGWALLHSISRWKSTTLTSFVAPTILGLTGAVLALFFRGVPVF